MIRINQLKLKLGRDERELESLIAGKLRTREKFTYEIVKKSLDARKKPELYFIYSVNVKIAKEISSVLISFCLINSLISSTVASLISSFVLFSTVIAPLIPLDCIK